MIEIIRNIPNTNRSKETFDLYQLQVNATKEGWLIYPQTLNPLTITIRKKKEKS